MNIVLYGTNKCQESRKALRFFKERGHAVQFRDLAQKPLSPGEVNRLCAGRSAAELINVNAPSYLRRGMAHMLFDPAQEILADNALLRTPIIRVDERVYLGAKLEEIDLGD